MKPWFVYTGIRVAIFVVAFIALLVAGVPAWLAAIISATIGLCAAYIFFRPQRDALATLVQDRREGRGGSTIDEDAEDAEDAEDS